jgi:thiamine-monophosphate kinase
MGALPRWATLGIAVPPAPTFAWLDDFSRGFFACADEFGVDLIGGDTTRGPRAFAVTIMGEVPAGQALRRNGAQDGDSIWISGTPGLAALGLAHLQQRIRLTEPQLGQCLAALHRPQPRVALGLVLHGLANAAIDVSDGLLADLGHILTASRLGAELNIPDLPPAGLERDCLLAGGDDYELIFTTPIGCDHEVLALSSTLGLRLTRIGATVTGCPGQLRLIDAGGQDITPTRRGFDHFA